jgi:L-rhamnose mutarotase
MPVFMVISRHNPESCWMHNPATRQIHLNLANNLESLLKKHKVSLLGCWFDLPGHALYEFYDAPDPDAFQKMATEPEILQWASFNTMEITMVTPLEDVMMMLNRPAC